MTVGFWAVGFIVCVLFGTKAVSGIRHYLVEERVYKSNIKIFDLTVAVIIGLIPGLNFFLGIIAVAMSLFFIIMEIYQFHGEFFQRDLFKKKNEE